MLLMSFIPFGCLSFRSFRTPPYIHPIQSTLQHLFSKSFKIFLLPRYRYTAIVPDMSKKPNKIKKKREPYLHVALKPIAAKIVVDRAFRAGIGHGAAANLIIQEAKQ
jgi:hypothetical protein